MKDEDIISYILRGKTELYSEIVDRYSGKVYSTVYNYTHDPEEAKDVTQDIFIKVYNSLGGFRGKSKFSTWLYRIAVNCCIDWTRKKRITASPFIIGRDDEELDIFDTIADPTYSPEDIFIRQEHAELVRETVESLPEIYRTVLILYYFEDFSPQEIADIVEAPKRTIETRLYRARDMIKTKLREVIYGGDYCELQHV